MPDGQVLDETLAQSNIIGIFNGNWVPECSGQYRASARLLKYFHCAFGESAGSIETILFPSDVAGLFIPSREQCWGGFGHFEWSCGSPSDSNVIMTLPWLSGLTNSMSVSQ